MKIIRVLTVIALTANIAAAQTTYQKTIIANDVLNHALSSVVYSTEYNTSTVLLANYYGQVQYTGHVGITKFNKNTGNATSVKTITIANADVQVNKVHQQSNMLYCTATITDSVAEQGAVFKYNLATNTLAWKKLITVDSTSSLVTSVTTDNKSNVYVLGTYYGSFGNNDLFVTKLDTNGVVLWTKYFGNTAWDEYAGDIVVKNNTQIYITSSGYAGVQGNPIIIRMDSAGTILQKVSLSTPSSPRFGGITAGILNGKLVTVASTRVGPSDPGPVLIRVLDSLLNETVTRTINGVTVKQVFFNANNLLITGQANVANGLQGFKTVRLDSNLNTVGARYFNTIPTTSIATSGSCFINAANESFHFFKTNGYDTIYVNRTNAQEETLCNDTAFAPFSDSLDYSVNKYFYAVDTLALAIKNIPLTVASMTVSTAANCSVITGLNLTNTNAKVIAYPNPAQNNITITAPQTISSLSITNLLGQTIATHTNLNSPTIVVPINELISGVYVVRLLLENETIEQLKIVKE